MYITTRQAHGSMDERTGYYGNQYSTHCNGISRFLCAHYYVNPPNLQIKCDGFLQTFSVRHAPSFSNGGLIISPHNKIRYNIIQLSQKSFPPNCICNEPLIHKGRIISEGEVYHGSSITETRGDILIRGLWERQMDAIIEIIFGDDDTETERTDKLFLRR